MGSQVKLVPCGKPACDAHTHKAEELLDGMLLAETCIAYKCSSEDTLPSLRRVRLEINSLHKQSGQQRRGEETTSRAVFWAILVCQERLGSNRARDSALARFCQTGGAPARYVPTNSWTSGNRGQIPFAAKPPSYPARNRCWVLEFASHPSRIFGGLFLPFASEQQLPQHPACLPEPYE